MELIVPNRKARTDLKLLDYACGTGAITQAFAAVCNEAVGIDIAPKMLARYDTLMKDNAPANFKVSSFEGDLFAREGPSTVLQAPNLYDFDVAAVGFGFHHFEDPSLCIRRLAERVSPGGSILIVDFQDEGGQLPAKAGITAHGFSEQRMKEIFEGEGLVDIVYYRVPGWFELQMHGNPSNKKAFLGRATKPAWSS